METGRHEGSRATRPGPASSARSRGGENGDRAQRTGARSALPPCLATVDVVRDGDRVRVTVRGELDFEAQDLRYELHEALRSSDTGVDLDLSAVSFCDCSGLNVLLDARQRALGQGKTVALRASSPAVERLLGLIGAQDLFAPPTVDASATGTTGHRHADPWDGERARGEAAPLRQVVRSRWKAAVTTSDAGAPVAVRRARVPAGSG